MGKVLLLSQDLIEPPGDEKNLKGASDFRRFMTNYPRFFFLAMKGAIVIIF